MTKTRSALLLQGTPNSQVEPEYMIDNATLQTESDAKREIKMDLITSRRGAASFVGAGGWSPLEGSKQ